MIRQSDGHVFVIAEAGVNHNGSLERALAMVDAAAEAGADAVKFQTFSAKALATSDAPKAEYQLDANTAESQLEMLQRLELSLSDHLALKRRCDELDIEFMSAAFDEGSLEMLAEVGIKRVKVPSGELTNVPLLRKLAGLGLPVLLSTGMADISEVIAAVGVLEKAGVPRERLTLLQCTTEYPTPPEEVNLRAMSAMGDALGVDIGYSDHTRGISVPVAAVALGARVLEKHFTLDRGLPGPDHAASLEPQEFAEMVSAVREVELALGDAQKKPGPSERRNMAAARKSIVAARAIAAGEILTEEALTTKRPGTGMSPLLWDEVLGRPATRDYLPDEQIAEVL